MPKGSQGRRRSLAISSFFTLLFYAVANKSLARLLWGEKWQIEIIPFSGLLLHRDCLLCLVRFLWMSLWPYNKLSGYECFRLRGYLFTVDMLWPWRREESISSPGTRVTNGCDLPCGCWDSNPGSLEKQPVLLTTGSFCQSSGALFLSSIYLTIHSFFVQP